MPTIPKFPSWPFGMRLLAAGHGFLNNFPLWVLRFCLSPAIEYIPNLACAGQHGSIGPALAQEAFMMWAQIEAGWTQLKDKFVFMPVVR